MTYFWKPCVPPLKVDISTGDVITPHEIEYSYKLMFEDRTIPIKAYNLETVLAEKIETVLSRGIENTRLRDYYDLYILKSLYVDSVNHDTLSRAFHATSEKRGSLHLLSDTGLILNEIRDNPEMQRLWKNYQRKYEYASSISWEQVMDAIDMLADIVLQTGNSP